MKKIIAIFLCIVALTSMLTSCSCSPYTDEELVEIFKTKYELTVVLNEYIWGDGIPVSEYDPEKVTLEAYYVEVAEDVEYRTKSAFLAAINSVYVSDYVNGEIDQLLFSGYGEDGPAPRYGEINGNLSRNVNDDGNVNVGEGRFLPETAKVKRASGNTAVFTVTYQRGDKISEYDLMMQQENGEWKFEGPTY